MSAPTHTWTVADVLAKFGPIPIERIRHRPPPGTATEQDVVEIETHEDRLCELIDGVLVEKVMGYEESCIVAELIRLLGNFVREHDLGIVSAPDGTMQLMPGCIRVPDAAFISWNRLPDRKPPHGPIPAIVPDLAVEILSRGNTPQEMQAKLQDYFTAGVRLVWYIDGATKTATSYTAMDQPQSIAADGQLGGGDVLPDFKLPLAKLFETFKKS